MHAQQEPQSKKLIPAEAEAAARGATLAAVEELAASTNSGSKASSEPIVRQAAQGSRLPPARWIAGPDGRFKSENTVFQAALAPDINTQGALAITVPAAGPGQPEVTLRSTVLGLAYVAPGEEDTIGFPMARTRSARGEIIGQDRVIFRDAFEGEGILCDVVMKITHTTIAQDVIVRGRLPEPALFANLKSSDDPLLAVITEFYDPPPPKLWNELDGGTVVQWGGMTMIRGKAFSLGEEDSGSAIEVHKAWLQDADQRWMLWEYLPYSRIKAEVEALPVVKPNHQGNLGPLENSATLLASLDTLLTPFWAVGSYAPACPLAPNTEPPIFPAAYRSEGAFLSAATSSVADDPGFVIDYIFSSQPLINIDFGYSAAKTGPAAAGQFGSDVWNTFNFPNSTDATLQDLLRSDGIPTSTSVRVQNAPGLWFFTCCMPPIDNMYDAYIYPWSGNITVTVSSLPAGTYDLYLYGRGPAQNANTVFTLGGVQESTSSTGNYWNTATWFENEQYVVYRNIVVSGGQSIVFTAAPGASGYTLLNGMQIVPSAPSGTIAEAVDQSAWNFTTEGSALWYHQTGTSVMDGDAAQSGAITQQQFSYFETGVQGPGTVSFYWKVSSESCCDPLKFKVDGYEVTPISGEVDWTQASVALNEDYHILRWEYSKDYSVDTGLDAGWVDDVRFVPPSLPVITSSPQSQTLAAMGSVIFSVTAYGSQPLQFQWYLNDKQLPGATGSALTLENVEPAQAGSYTVMVSNSEGDVTSSPATLTVTEPDVDNDTLPDWWEMKHFGDLVKAIGDGDFDGDTRSDSTEFGEGTDPNNVSFVVFPENDYVQTATVSITVEVMKGLAGEIAWMVNSTAFDQAQWSPFNTALTVSLPVQNGKNEIWIGVRGIAGAQSAVSWTRTKVFHDTQPPVITISTPSALTWSTSSDLLQVVGTSSEPVRQLRYDLANSAGNETDLDAFVTHQNYDKIEGRFTLNDFQLFDVALASGANTITLRATDQAGNVATTVLNVTLSPDGTVSDPQINWPSDGAKLSGTEFSLDGVIDDPAESVEVEVASSGGEPATYHALVERNGHFWADNMALPDGQSTVTVTVKDVWNNTFSKSVTVSRSAETLTINSPSEQELLQSTLLVTGTAPAGWTVWVNGVSADVAGGSWFVELPNSAGGIFSVAAVAYAPGHDGEPIHAIKAKENHDEPARIYVERAQDDRDDYRYVYLEMIDGPGGSASWTSTSERWFEVSQDWKAGEESEGRWEDHRKHVSSSDPFLQEAICTDEITWPPSQCENLVAGVSVVTGACTGLRPPHNPPPTLGYDHCEVLVPVQEPTTEYVTYVNAQLGQWWRATGSGQYNRLAQTTLKLSTGGRSGVRRNSLFVLEGGADLILDKRALPPYEGSTPKRPVPYEQVTIGDLGALENDGKLYKALPDHDSIDVTPKVASDFYAFRLTQQKHELIIKAKGTDVTDQHFREIVGSKNTFTCELVPPVAITTYKWSVPGKIIDDWIASNSEAHIVPVASFTQSSISFAWVDAGNNRNVTCKIVVKGQTLTARTTADVFRPQWIISTSLGTVACNNDYNQSSSGEDWVHYGAGSDKVPGITFTRHKIQYDGYKAWVQVGTESRRIKKNGSWRKKEGTGLDHRYPYDDVQENLTNDSPGQTGENFDLAGVSESVVNDSYDMYMMFRPPVTGQSVWVPLRKVHWTWNGNGTFSYGVGTLVSGSGQADPDQDTTDHPTWTRNLADDVFVNE